MTQGIDKVLLTRGRDGFIIYVPNNSELDDVYFKLIESGVREFKGQ